MRLQGLEPLVLPAVSVCTCAPKSAWGRDRTHELNLTTLVLLAHVHRGGLREHAHHERLGEERLPELGSGVESREPLLARGAGAGRT